LATPDHNDWARGVEHAVQADRTQQDLFDGATAAVPDDEEVRSFRGSVEHQRGATRLDLDLHWHRRLSTER
jgi:hypothetical protein